MLHMPQLSPGSWAFAVLPAVPTADWTWGMCSNIMVLFPEGMMQGQDSRAANNGVGVDGFRAVLWCLPVCQEWGVAPGGQRAEDAVSNMVTGVVIAVEAKEGNHRGQDLHQKASCPQTASNEPLNTAKQLESNLKLCPVQAASALEISVRLGQVKTRTGQQ